MAASISARYARAPANSSVASFNLSIARRRGFARSDRRMRTVPLRRDVDAFHCVGLDSILDGLDGGTISGVLRLIASDIGSSPVLEVRPRCCVPAPRRGRHVNRGDTCSKTRNRDRMVNELLASFGGV